MKNDPVPRSTQNTHAVGEDDGRKIGKNVREQNSVKAQVAAFETAEAQKSVTEAPKATVDSQKSSIEAPKASGESHRTSSEAPKATVEVSKSSVDEQKASIEAPKATGESHRTSTDAPKTSAESQKTKTKSKKKVATQEPTGDTLPHDNKVGDKSSGATTASRAKNDVKKKKKRNLWPLKAVIISFLLAFAVNAGSELVLKGAQLWLAVVMTVVILALGVIFDMIGTAATSCNVQPFLSMAARKVKGAKTAVKLAKSSDVVSSVCCDIVGDICGIVSGVCAATIATKVVFGNDADFWISVTIYAVISMATISLKALGKGVAVNKANGIVFNVARVLSVFSREK